MYSIYTTQFGTFVLVIQTRNVPVCSIGREKNSKQVRFEAQRYASFLLRTRSSLDGDGLFERLALRFAAHLFPIGQGESKLGQDLFMRNRIVVLTPFVCL